MNTAHLLNVASETAAMGFWSSGTAMVECLRAAAAPVSFSDVRTAHSGQAAAPRVSGSGYGAVNDNASKALAADVGLFPMNTATTSPAVAGMFARKVTEVTGLSLMALDRLHASDMGSPGHFMFLPGAAGGMFYTVTGLSRLVEILHAESHTVAAKCLAATLDEIRTPPPPPVAPAGRNVRGELDGGP